MKNALVSAGKMTKSSCGGATKSAPNGFRRRTPPRGKQIIAIDSARRNFLQFAVSGDERSFRTVGSEQKRAIFLPPWDRGVRVALTVGGADNDRRGSDFYESTDSGNKQEGKVKRDTGKTLNKEPQ